MAKQAQVICIRMPGAARCETCGRHSTANWGRRWKALMEVQTVSNRVSQELCSHSRPPSFTKVKSQTALWSDPVIALKTVRPGHQAPRGALVNDKTQDRFIVFCQGLALKPLWVISYWKRAYTVKSFRVKTIIIIKWSLWCVRLICPAKPTAAVSCSGDTRPRTH